MYTRVEGNLRLTRNQASLRYPDNYILIQKENTDLLDPAGVVMFIGDDFDELFALQVDLPVPMGVVYEGVNLQNSLGGICR